MPYGCLMLQTYGTHVRVSHKPVPIKVYFEIMHVMPYISFCFIIRTKKPIELYLLQSPKTSKHELFVTLCPFIFYQGPFLCIFFPQCLSFQTLLSEAEITCILKRLRCVRLLKPTHSPFSLFFHLKVQPLFPVPFTILRPFFILLLFCHTFTIRNVTAIFFLSHTHKSI